MIDELMILAIQTWGVYAFNSKKCLSKNRLKRLMYEHPF